MQSQRRLHFCFAVSAEADRAGQDAFFTGGACEREATEQAVAGIVSTVLTSMVAVCLARLLTTQEYDECTDEPNSSFFSFQSEDEQF